ncbi:hypothetical protein Tco_0972806 [Tanacetum coccineum]
MTKRAKGSLSILDPKAGIVKQKFPGGLAYHCGPTRVTVLAVDIGQKLFMANSAYSLDIKRFADLVLSEFWHEPGNMWGEAILTATLSFKLDTSLRKEE